MGHVATHSTAGVCNAGVVAWEPFRLHHHPEPNSAPREGLPSSSDCLLWLFALWSLSSRRPSRLPTSRWLIFPACTVTAAQVLTTPARRWRAGARNTAWRPATARSLNDGSRSGWVTWRRWFFRASCGIKRRGAGDGVADRSPARASRWRLRHLGRLTWPAAGPLRQRVASAASMEPRSCGRPAAKVCRACTPQVLARPNQRVKAACRARRGAAVRDATGLHKGREAARQRSRVSDFPVRFVPGSSRRGRSGARWLAPDRWPS